MTAKTRPNERAGKREVSKPLRNVFANYFFVLILVAAVFISLLPEMLSYSINFVIKTLQHSPAYVIVEHSDELLELSLYRGSARAKFGLKIGDPVTVR